MCLLWCFGELCDEMCGMLYCSVVDLGVYVVEVCVVGCVDVYL